LPTVEDLADVESYLTNQSTDLMAELNRIIDTTTAPEED
jgi:hypothetical protein